MKTKIIISLLLASTAFAALDPNPETRNNPVNDPFFGYQWGLRNQGQSITPDLGDIYPGPRMDSNPSVQIGWKNYDSQMKRDVIVAILDSGIYSGPPDHPDLAGQILPGKNFTGNNPSQDNILNDTVGHGTHMAGLLAALSNNKEGIAGISNRIKILPLKVYAGNEKSSTDNPDDVNQSGKRETISGRVIKAIDFAIEKKADILHFSMGWPRVHNTPAVEAAFSKAHAAGLIVVAAAGNDGHDAQIYPCAYRNVICVGALNIDGTLADFSNYGGHVDLLAPGQEILSTWPLTMTSHVFGPKGYEIKSGTSQAAPFVSGAAAILRGLYPNESAEKIRARLLTTATRLTEKVNFGLLNIEKAVQVQQVTLVAPVFKAVEDSIVQTKSLSFQFPLTVEKIGASSAQIKVKSLRSDIQISSLQKISESPSEIKFQVSARVASLQSEAIFPYSVEVNGQSFQSRLLLKIDMLSLPVQRLPLTDAATIKKSGLFSVADPSMTHEVRYWTYDSNPAKNNLKLSVWNLKNNVFENHQIVLDQLTEPLVGFNLIADDFDMSGKTGYLFVGVLKEAGDFKGVEFVYLDENLNIKYRMPLKVEGSIPVYQNIKDIALAKVQMPDGRPLKVPAYWRAGLAPEKDVNPDLFAFEVNQALLRLYYFEPIMIDGKLTMQTRTLIATPFEKQLREKLGITIKQSVDYLATTVQNKSDVKTGQFDLLFSVGKGVDVDLYKMRFTDLSRRFETAVISKFPRTNLDLSKNLATDAINLSKTEPESETNFTSIYSFVAARSLILRGLQLGGTNLSLKDRAESIINVTKTFTKNSDLVSFFETTKALRAQGTWNAKPVDAQIPIYRSTFLPGSLFSQIFVPVLASSSQKPGILVDNSQIFSNSILVYTLENDGRLSNQIQRSLDAPANCKLRRVPMLSEKNSSRLAFVCQEGEQLELRLVDLQ